MNYQIKALEAEKDKILRDLYENGKFLNKIDKILNASKSQNKENLDQIGLLSQKLDEVNEIFHDLIFSVSLQVEGLGQFGANCRYKLILCLK